MIRHIIAFVVFGTFLLSGTLPFCAAQSCLPPPADPIMVLQAGVNDAVGQTVDSVYVQWLPADDALAYHYEVWLDGTATLFNTTATTQFSFSLLPMGWNIAEVRLQTLCTDGSLSETRTAAIVATVDEVYKIYQTGNCNDFGTCSACLCQAIEALLEDSTTLNNLIENTDYLGTYGCAPFLNRFMQFNTATLIDACPCFMPKQACYDNYPCNGFNCSSTGLRQTSGEPYSWRVQNNAARQTLIVEHALQIPANWQLYLYDLNGYLLQTILPDLSQKNAGQYRNEIYPPRQGIYILELRINDVRKRQKVAAIW